VVLSVTPAATALGNAVTANVSGAVSRSTYLVNWGDGTSESISGSGTYSLPHTYQVSGVFVITVSTAGIPPATATVTISTIPPVLEVQPSPSFAGQTVTASFRSLSSFQKYTLDWGDNSAVETFQGIGLPRNHTYAQAGTFRVTLNTPGAPPVIVPVVVNYGCTLSLTSSIIQPGSVANFLLSGHDVGSGKLAGFPSGVPFTIDWGDGSAPQAGTSSGAPQPLNYVFNEVGPAVVKVNVAGNASCILPVTVDLPNAALSVDAQRAGTPSTITLTGLASSPTLLYVLDFGDGTSPEPVSAAKLSVKHVYLRSGTYPVQLRLNGKAGASRVLAAGVALIPPEVGTLDVRNEIRFASKVGQPVPATGVTAPTGVEIPLGVQAASVSTIVAQGSGNVTLRWTWIPANGTPGSETSSVLSQQTVALVAGSNAVPLSLPTTIAGLFTLKVEILGDPGDVKALLPTITVQPVRIVPTPPKVLVVGTGDNQFRFNVTKVIYRSDVVGSPAFGGIAYDSVPTTFDPNNFWAELTLEQPIVIGALPVPVTVSVAQKLKITQDGETATLVSGTILAGTTASGKNETKIPFIGDYTKADSNSPAFALPALFPMQLKIDQIRFGVDGTYMVHPLLTSPDYTQTPVTSYLYKLLSKYLKEKSQGTKPGSGPDDMRQLLEGRIFEPSVSWNSVGGVGGSPVLVPVTVPGGGANRPAHQGALLALGHQGTAPIGDGSGPRLLGLAGQGLRIPANLTATGSGYGTFKGAAVLAQAADKGIQLDYGVTLTDGSKLTDQSSAGGGVPTIIKDGGHFDLVATLGGPVDISALDTILGQGQHDFLDFPRLELNNHGFVASTRMVAGVSQASWPMAYGFAGGNQKLGSDSGVSVNLPGDAAVPIYLDLNPEVSVQPQGYGAAAGNVKVGSGSGSVTAAVSAYLSGPLLDQSSVLRQTYSGAPAVVKVPDVGPAWQGLVWIADNVQADSVLNADPKNPQAGNPVKFSAPLQVAAPISFGLGGWNFNIDGDLANGGGTAHINGWDWKTSHIAIAMVRSNLIKSLQKGAVGPLPFLGGNVISAELNGDNVTIENTALTRSYGPDGSFTSTTVSYSAAKVAGSNQKIGAFQMGGSFDLSRIGSGLTLSCSSLNITPNLDALPYSSCNFAGLKGNHSIAGTTFSVDNAYLTLLKPGESGYDDSVGPGALQLTGSALVGDTPSGPVTAPNSSFTLRASGSEYKLTLVTGAIAQAVQNGTDNGLNLKFKGKVTDLTGVGIAAFGAGGAGVANKELSFDSGELAVSDSLTMQIKGTFGHEGSKSYWYVLANGKVDPCLSVLGVFNVCEIYGGLAYNMKWKSQDGSLVQFSALNSRPLPDSDLHLALGVVGNVIDKQTVNIAGLVVINPAEFSLDFGGDLYLFKAYKDGAPQARFGGTLGTSGIFLAACVGPAAPLPGSQLNCADLQQLSLVDVLFVRGRADLSIGYKGHTYFYLGTHNAPIEATVDLKVAKFTVSAYVMTGELDGQGLPPIRGLKPATGIAAGAAIDYHYHESGSASVLICDATWHFDAHLYASVDTVYTVDPFQVGGDMRLGVSAEVGGSLCGVGGSVGAGIDLSAAFLLTQTFGYADGTAHVFISLPIVPDVDADFHVHVTIYGKEP
jgi:hypothetical protein